MLSVVSIKFGNIQSPPGNTAGQSAMKEPEADPKNVIKSRELLYRLIIRLFIIVSFARTSLNSASSPYSLLFLHKARFLYKRRYNQSQV